MPRFLRPRERKRVLSKSQARPKESTVPAGWDAGSLPTHGTVLKMGAGQPSFPKHIPWSASSQTPMDHGPE